MLTILPPAILHSALASIRFIKGAKRAEKKLEMSLRFEFQKLQRLFDYMKSKINHIQIQELTLKTALDDFYWIQHAF